MASNLQDIGLESDPNILGITPFAEGHQYSCAMAAYKLLARLNPYMR